MVPEGFGSVSVWVMRGEPPRSGGGCGRHLGAAEGGAGVGVAWGGPGGKNGENRGKKRSAVLRAAPGTQHL